MLINYGSFMYFAYIFITLFICFALYFILRKHSDTVKRTAVYILAAVNFLQHALKLIIYPQYAGSGDFYLCTAYNICAFLIIVSPFIMLFGSELLKNYITYIGSAAGMVAMVVPYWYIGKSAFGPDVYRFYFCHGLLFIASFLPGILGLHKLNIKHCWKIGLLFLSMLLIILANDSVLILTGNYLSYDPNKLFESLRQINPGWSMGPSPSMAWVEDIVAVFTPPFLMGDNPWGIHIPVLWYGIPIYCLITLSTYLICLAVQSYEKKRGVKSRSL